MPSTVIYARKSTESDDRQVLSIDSQIQELKLLAHRRGFSVAETLTEARSAKAPGRPIFDQLMRRVERGEIESVLCWKLDRLARNHADTGRVLQALADRKLRSVVTFERDYTADGNDRFLGNFELGIATKYIDDLRVNVRRGNRARFQRGWPNYRPPQGYLEDRATKTIIKDPERFDQVRRMWDLLLSREMRPSQILRHARDEWGYRTRRGTRLALSALHHMFSNPYYMGLIRLRSGESYPGAHEPMVTPEEFERAQQVLGRNDRPRSARHDFPYSGIFKCACGGTLVGEEHNKRNGRRYVYYRCHGRRTIAPCRQPSLSEAAFDHWLEGELRRYTIPLRMAAWIRTKLKQGIEAEATQQDGARTRLQRDLEQATREGDALLDLRLRGQVDGDTWDRKRLEILERQAKLRMQLERPEAKPDAMLAALDRALDFPHIGIDVLRERSIVGRRQLVHTLGSNWRVDQRKPLYTAKKPFSLIEGAGVSSLWWARLKELRTWLLEESQGNPIPDLRAAHSVPRAA